MAWKRLTFLLIPHSQKTIKQIGIHRNVLYTLTVFFVVAIGIMVFYIIGFNQKSFYLKRTRDLANKNSILIKNLALFDSSLTSMSTQITYLESINTLIIEESRISAIDLELGGDVPIDSFNEDAIKLPRRTLAIIDRLDRESEVFEYNFTTLYEKCMSNVDFIKCVPSIRPASGKISREFGTSFDIISKTEKTHPGVDIDEIEGTPVVAPADGVVEQIEFSDELGRYILIDHQNGYKTRYAHLQSKVIAKKGNKVVRGQQIGAIGQTGISITAVSAHLLYSVYHHGMPVNPTDYFFASDFASPRYGESSEVQMQ